MGAEFRPGLGFVRRRGINHYFATFGVHPSVDRFGLQEINPYVMIDYFTNLESVLEVRLRFIHAPLSDLYLVYSEQRDVRGDLGPQQSVALKVTRLLAF